MTMSHKTEFIQHPGSIPAPRRPSGARAVNDTVPRAPVLQSTVRSAPAPKTNPLETLSGMDEARAWGLAMAADVALCKEGRLDWSEIDPGCVLYGPPGTGKSNFAKLFADACDLPLIQTSYADWQGSGEGHLGSTMTAMKATFRDAAERSPCVLLIDELDSIQARGGSGGHANGYAHQMTNAVLTEFDTLNKDKGVIIIGTCNHPDQLDPALIRSGRMDRMIEIKRPDIRALEGILRYHLKRDEIRQLMEHRANALSDVALLCAGMTGADVAKAVRSARQASRRTKAALSFEAFLEVLDPAARLLPDEAQYRIAAHEAGYALLATRFGIVPHITASMIRRGSPDWWPGDHRDVVTQDQYLLRITVLLAGRAAEEVLHGAASTIAGGSNEHNDLATATRMACHLLSRNGFSDAMGLAWFGQEPTDRLILSHPRLADEVKSLLATALHKARLLLEADKSALIVLAKTLLARRVLAHDQIADIAARHPKQPSPA